MSVSATDRQACMVNLPPMQRVVSIWDGAAVAAISLGTSVIKIKHEVQKDKNVKYSGIIGTIQTMYNEEGLRAFFKGGLTSIVLDVVGGTSAVVAALIVRNILFTKQELEIEDKQNEQIARRRIGKQTGTISPLQSAILNTTSFHLRRLFTVSSIYICSRVAMYPVDTIKNNLMVQTNKERYNGIIDCAKKLRDQGRLTGSGIAPFYNGFGASISASVAYQVSHSCLSLIIEKLVQGEKRDHKMYHYARVYLPQIFGYLVAHPFVLIQHRLQTGDDYGNLGILGILSTIYESEGMRGLYKGLLFF